MAGIRRRHALAWLALPAGVARADLPDVVDTVRPGIVAVGTFRATDSPRFTFYGTGFAVGSGLQIATNAHVVAPAVKNGEAALAVLTMRGRQATEMRPARVAGVDAVHDVAVLKIDGAPLPALTLDAEPVREGTAVAFVGFPIGGVLGFSAVTHRGIVSAVTPIVLPQATAHQLDERAIVRLREGAFEVYQLDATAYPGNSGGPLFAAATGRVIGIVNMVLVRGTRESALTNPTGISYAIPVRHVRDLIARL